MVANVRRRGRPRNDARPPDAPTTKELIQLAAAESFATHGFDGASLAGIATAAGVTTGAVYSHFTGKAELLLTVVSSTLDAVDPRRRAGQLEPHYLHDWIDWLMAIEQAQLRSLVAEIHHAALRDPEVRSLLTAYGHAISAGVEDFVRQWQIAGSVATAHDPTATARMFMTLTLGLCTMAAFRPDVLANEDYRDVLHRQLDDLLGIGASGVT